MDSKLKQLIEERIAELEDQLKNYSFIPGTRRKVLDALDRNLKLLGRKRNEE